MAPAESTPLLGANCDDRHHNLFSSLDADHCHDHCHDHPPTPKMHRVKSQLGSATTASGHCHPAHHQLQSPSLHLRLRQSFDHGFRSIWDAVLHGVSNLPHAPSRGPSSPRTATRAVFVLAVLTMLAMTSISPTILLFMNEADYTSPTHIAPYVMASALSTAVPIFSNVALTSLASRVGPGRALAVASFLAAVGILTVAVFRGNVFVFFLAYGLYTSCNSMRVVRVALLSKVVAPATRTSVLATHALMTPLGALVGPLIWIVCQTYRDSFRTFFGNLLVDRFTLVYFIAAGSLFAISVVAAAFLSSIITYEHENDEDAATTQNTGADNNTGELRAATLHYADGHDQEVDLARYRNHVFQYFCFVMLGVNMSAGIYMTAFQPIIVNVFHTSDAKLGLIFEIIAIFAVIPPLLVALLSRYLMDRQILVIGLGAKLVGMLLFLPLFGHVREWQVIAGFLLIIKASIFFSTASMSLFTKLLGPMSTSSLLGLLASCSAIGPAVTQILLSSRIISWFGSAAFALFAIPAIISLGAILWPSKWRKLDPSGEFTELVTHEAGLQQAGDA